MNGIVVIDKPANMTSAHVVARVKRVLKAKKAGHTGTLDPFATGVLVCCINQATRLAQFLTHGTKRYEAVMRLGIRTDTQDFTGRVVAKEQTLAVTEHEIHSVFRRFVDTRRQSPPCFSALKYRGVPLYKLARKGTLVQKPSRRICIYELEILEIDLPCVSFEVSCSQGTYIRTLCADMGDALGCGAHLARLRRTESGGFSLEEAISLDTLAELAAAGKAPGCVLPMSDALRGVREVRVRHGLAQSIRYGQPVTGAELGPVEDESGQWIKITDAKRNLIAVLGARNKNGVYPYACVFTNNE